MLNPKIEEALNRQINAELASAYLYLSMAAWFESQNLRGMAHWMRVQSQEELAHALKIYDFIHDRNGRVRLAAVEAPKGEWDGPLAAFEDALAHERKITGLIGGLVNLAAAEKDHATAAFLQWFVTEQVEEEAAAQAIVDKLQLVGGHPMGLFAIDSQLAGRGAGGSE